MEIKLDHPKYKSKLVARKPSKACGCKPIYVRKDAKVIKAKKYKVKHVHDPKGYFLIKVEKDNILVGLCSYKNEMKKIIKGKDATSILNEIVKRQMCSKKDHLIYLTEELVRAENALRNKKRFIQR